METISQVFKFGMVNMQVLCIYVMLLSFVMIFMDLTPNALSYLSGYHPESVSNTHGAMDSKFERATSYTTVNIDESVQGNRSVEYFFSSDARYYVNTLDVAIHSLFISSAVIEHTNRVIYLEENDVAAVTANGGMGLD